MTVPVEREALPVQRIISRDGLLRLKVQPSLSAELAGTRIPRNGQRLKTTIRPCHEVLLERIYAECVDHAQSLDGSSRLLDLDDKVFSITDESPISFEMPKGRAVELADDRLDGRFFHRPVVIRTQPSLTLPRMAVGASLHSDELERSRGRFVRSGLDARLRLITTHRQHGETKCDTKGDRDRLEMIGTIQHAGTFAQLLDGGKCCVTNRSSKT